MTTRGWRLMAAEASAGGTHAGGGERPCQVLILPVTAWPQRHCRRSDSAALAVRVRAADRDQGSG